MNMKMNLFAGLCLAIAQFVPCAADALVVSATVKGEGVIDLFPKAEERQKAIAWFKKHGVTRVYVETFRHGRRADEALLRTCKAEFEAAGLEIYGAICPTTAKVQSFFRCAMDTASQELMADVTRMTARIFDRIMLDDFLFMTCTCEGCQKLKGDKSWGEFRTAFKLELDRKFILEPAREVKSDVIVYIKYPQWYENFYNNGYDVVRESALFGDTWIGTETREPDDPAGRCTPQTQANWIQGWANDFSNCGGAWFDPLGTKPATYVEQARGSILGGAKEILLHAYDYLGTDSIGIAAHGDGKVPWGKADAEAFRLEKDALLELARMIEDKEKEGVLCVKRPNFSAGDDARLNSYIGMLGLPILPGASLKDAKADFLSLGSADVRASFARLKANRAAGRPTLVTQNLLKALSDADRASLGVPANWLSRARAKTFVEKIDETLVVLGNDGDRWDVTKLPPADLAEARHTLLRPFGLTFEAPTRVALHLFRGKQGERVAVLENFNNEAVTVTLSGSGGKTAWAKVLALPRTASAELVEITPNYVRLTLSARSLIALKQD